MLDIGVNLTSRQFAGDVPQVVARARQAGLNGMIITGTSLEESTCALHLAQAYPGFCWSTAGVHPHDADGWNDDCVAGLERLLSASSVVAVGECGLDFARNFSSPARQEAAFEAQLMLAARLGKPVFLHCREAHARFIALLRPWLSHLPGAVLHCFTGDRDALDACLSLGLYIGITGWVCDERRGLALRELLPHIPADRLLLETDAPYLLPRDIHIKPMPRRNEPCFLPHIAEQVARWRQQDANWLKQVTENNARHVFRLA